MIKQFVNKISFNKKWMFAALFYVGVALFLLALTPSSRSLLATSGCEGITCPEGKILVMEGERCECQCPTE